METCLICRSKKARANCDLCEAPLCEKCTERLTEESFAYSLQKPEIAKHSKFCPNCFDEQVNPVLTEYNDVVERAKQVVYLPKAYRTYVHVLKMAKLEVSVKDLESKHEAIMGLAFQAAEQGFNAIIKAEVESTKVRTNGYQKSIWRGVAMPAKIDEEKLKLEEYREEVWRRGY